jgi:phage shock protein C
LKKLKKEHNITDMKKLYKNEHDEVLTGVIGGIGEYFSIDPTVLRIAFVVLVLITGVFPGIIAYIIAYFIIPEKPHGVSTLVTPPPMKTEPKPEVKQEQKVEEKVVPKEEPVTPVPTPEPKMETPEPGPITSEESKVTVEDLLKPSEPVIIGGEDELTEKDADEPKTPATL